MSKKKVAIVRYEKPYESVKKAVELSGGFAQLPRNARVFIKPNIVFWTKTVQFPKWGVITTSRVIEDVVRLLKEHGVDDITIGEGIVGDLKDKETPAHAFKTLGYDALNKRYGVKAINIMERPFEKVDLGKGISLNFNSDILHSDYIVDIPAMKSHNQTIVSLGIKNLKGTIDMKSRKKCHNADSKKDLHFCVSRLPDKLPPIFTLIDGIYSLERGPAFDGKMRKSNILIASSDILSADMAGARVLGHKPESVLHIMHAAKNRNRSLDFSDIEIVGEKIEDVASLHEWDFLYTQTENGEIPTPMTKDGIEGLFYRKFDSTMCTYCSGLNGLMLSAIRYAWKGKPWDRVELLTGKKMKPAAGMNKTILMGKCMVQAHKDNPDIKEMIPIKGCPPKIKDMINALHQAGIDVNPALFEQVDQLPGFFMSRYAGKPEFDEGFFRIEQEG